MTEIPYETHAISYLYDVLILQLPTYVFINPAAIRDHINGHLPHPEVIGVASSKQGNLVITCRTAVGAVINISGYQGFCQLSLVTVKRIHDEER